MSNIILAVSSGLVGGTTLYILERIREARETKRIKEPELDPEVMLVFESLYNTMVFDQRDWSLGRRNAWLYGIVVGWNDDDYIRIKDQHGWSTTDINRNKELRGIIKKYIRF